jgi:uncharacterized RDD family membrane protein YckC
MVLRVWLARVHGEIACEVDRNGTGDSSETAPLGARVLAAVLDSIVVFLVWLLIIRMWGDEGPDGGKVLTGIPAVLLMLGTAAFWIFPEWLLGSTMGKWACDLQVTTLNGGSISFVQSLKRNVLDCSIFFRSI